VGKEQGSVSSEENESYRIFWRMMKNYGENIGGVNMNRTTALRVCALVMVCLCLPAFSLASRVITPTATEETAHLMNYREWLEAIEAEYGVDMESDRVTLDRVFSSVNHDGTVSEGIEYPRE
jgi:hypothetical protein